MASNPLRKLLCLSAPDRAELAMALWESLSEAERSRAFELTETQKAELDRRWTEHLADPSSGVPWADIRSKLLD